jgi:hypothetical protein
MRTVTVSDPTYLPGGYKLSLRVHGPEAGGLGMDASQTGMLYRRGTALEDWRNPLAVYVSGSGAPALVATEARQGEQIDLSIVGIEAIYHDGLWMLGQGAEQLEMGDVIVHWDSSALHSITARWDGGTCAVRGPKGRGVGYDELIKVVKSMFSPGSLST